MFELGFNILGEDQYLRSFQVLGSELGSLRDPLGEVSSLLSRTTGENFQSEGGHGAGGWQPLNADYDAWKQEQFPGRPMLVLTGAMRRALLVDGERELTDRKLVWGIDDQTDDDGQPVLERALAHQHGKGRLPQRKVVALTFEDQRAIDRIFTMWVAHVRRRLPR